jgi:hypothetical protein
MRFLDRWKDVPIAQRFWFGGQRKEQTRVEIAESIQRKTVDR